MEQARSTQKIEIWAYVIMPEHVHMLVYPTQDDYDMGHVLAALALHNALSKRSNTDPPVGHQLADLAHGNADLARQVAETRERLAAMEGPDAEACP